MHFHTALEFRHMLLALTEDPPDLGVLPMLADWLEDRGDWRASIIKGIASHPLRARQDARESLELFPEGPRWTAKTSSSIHLWHVASCQEGFLTPRLAQAGELHKLCRVDGPHWSEKPVTEPGGSVNTVSQKPR
jgi:hypothetical protein